MHVIYYAHKNGDLAKGDVQKDVGIELHIHK